MTAKIDEKLIGLWFIPIPEKFEGVPGDWQADLREEAPRHYIFQYRFRWYADDEPWSENDVKRWHAYEIVDLPREEVLAKTQSVVRAMEEQMQSKADEILMDDSGPIGFAKRLCEMPWAHARVEMRGVPR